MYCGYYLKSVYLCELPGKVIDVVLWIERFAKYAVKKLRRLEPAAVLPDVLAVPLVDRPKVSGGDDLRGGKVPKYRCERCGQKYALPKGPNGMN